MPFTLYRHQMGKMGHLYGVYPKRDTICHSAFLKMVKIFHIFGAYPKSPLKNAIFMVSIQKMAKYATYIVPTPCEVPKTCI